MHVEGNQGKLSGNSICKAPSTKHKARRIHIPPPEFLHTLLRDCGYISLTERGKCAEPARLYSHADSLQMLYAHTLTLLRPLALCARPQLCGRFLSPIPLPSHVRHSSHKSLKAIKARKGTPPKSTPKPKVNAPDKAPEPKAKAPDTLFSLPSFVPLEAQLGSLPHPTLLYQKSHWRIALLCYAFTGIGVWVMFNNYQVNIVRPVGIPEWVKKAHYVGIAFIGIGVAAAFVYPAR